MEEGLVLLQQQKDKALKHNTELLEALDEVSGERDTLRDELHKLKVSSGVREDELQKRIDEELKEKEDIRSKLHGSRDRIRELLDEKSERIRFLSEHLVILQSVKEFLMRAIDSMDEGKLEGVVDQDEEMRGEKETETESDEELGAFCGEVKAISKLASVAEVKFSEYQEMREEVGEEGENRDINSLLRFALVEKEAVEKSLNKLKGNNEQKRVAILQIAERGLIMEVSQMAVNANRRL
ncbi:hypothetical protein U1Q18_004585 [Sarracenia purpurea var. burkii]